MAGTQDTDNKNANELKKAKRQVEHQLDKHLRNTEAKMKKGSAKQKRNTLNSEL